MTENEALTVVPSENYGDPKKTMNPIAAILKGKKGSALEHLVNASHCKLNKQHGYITDVAGNVIKISQLFEYHGIITTGAVRCPQCFETVTYDLLFYHFDDHKFSIDKIYDLFKRNFEQWRYYDGRITYLEQDIKI